jgi:hypothetical protein
LGIKSRRQKPQQLFLPVSVALYRSFHISLRINPNLILFFSFYFREATTSADFPPLRLYGSGVVTVSAPFLRGSGVAIGAGCEE